MTRTAYRCPTCRCFLPRPVSTTGEAWCAFCGRYVLPVKVTLR